MPSKPKSFLGFKYFLGVHSAFCHAPIDHVSHLYFGDELGWRGEWTGALGDRLITIDEPGLFGGEEEEGGVQGDFRMLNLREGHTYVNEYMIGQLGSENISGYRGVMSIVAERPYLGMNPYMKPMTAVVHRIGTQWIGQPQWEPDYARIPWNWDEVSGDVAPPVEPIGDDSYEFQGTDLETNTLFVIAYARGETTANGDPYRMLFHRIRDRLVENLENNEHWGDYLYFLRIAAGNSVGIPEPGDIIQTSWASQYQGRSDVPAQWNQAKSVNYGFEGSTVEPLNPNVGSWGQMLGGSAPAAMSATYPFSPPPDIHIPSYSPGPSWVHKVVIILISEPGDPDPEAEDDFYTSVMSHVQNAKDAYFAGSEAQVRFHWIRPSWFLRPPGSPTLWRVARINSHVDRIMDDFWNGDSDTFSGEPKPAIEPVEDEDLDGLPSRTGDDMNPAHILRECIRNPFWGLGQPAAEIDNADFLAAAIKFYDEGMGLSLKWSQEGPVQEFMKIVCDHANAICYVSARTGLWRLRPIRDDYDPELIPHLVYDDDVIRIESMSRRQPSEMINSITVNYYDIDKNGTKSRTLHNIAAIQALGRENSTTVNYDGIIRDDLALRVGERDLLILGFPLLTANLHVSRKHYYFEPGDVFVFSAPAFGVSGIVMRIMDVDYGSFDDATIKLSTTQDIFSINPQNVQVPVPPVLPPIIPSPQPINRRYVTEAPYYFALQQLGPVELSGELDLNPDVGGIHAVAAPPHQALSNARIQTSLSGVDEFSPNGNMTFTAGFTLAESVDNNPVITELVVQNSWAIENITEDSLLYLGHEIVRVTAIDLGSNPRTVSVARGCLDTVPASHMSGTFAALIGPSSGYVMDGYSQGHVIDVKLQSQTQNAVFPLDLAETDTVSFDSRMIRPYPVGDFKVDNDYVFALEDWTGTLNLTWVHRNRLTQTADFVLSYTDAGVDPEPGVSYEVRVWAYDLFGEKIETPVFSHNVGTDTSYSFDTTDVTIPGDAQWTMLELAVISVRDGYDNWTYAAVTHIIPIDIANLAGIPAGWYDANIPGSLYSEMDKTVTVSQDEDPIVLIENLKGTIT